MLKSLQQELAQHPQTLSHVTLSQKTADDFEGIPTTGVFDTVIINSVLQYFPSVEYVKDVIRKSAAVISSDGGVIFVGDIQSFPLLHTFHTSVQLYQSPPSLTKSQLRQRVQLQLSHENVFYLAQDFFAALQQELPDITYIRIQPRRGKYHNEMSCFRYDAILYVRTPPPVPVEYQWIDWREEKLTLPAIHRLLLESAPESLAIANIPNARLLDDHKAVDWLTSEDEPETVGELRETLKTLSPEGESLDPEDLWALGEKVPYIVDINWTRPDSTGSFDVLFRRRPAAGEVSLPYFLPEPGPQKPWSAYANDPLHGKHLRTLIPRLRSCLEEKLPGYMVPAAFVLLDALPLTPNGKVDRRVLPAPERVRPELEQPFIAPRTDLEAQLVEIWQDLLDLERVGVEDDFFALGGDSLIGTRLAARIQETFDLDLPVTELFETHTIAGLAEIIEQRIAEEIDQLSEEDVQRLMAEMGEITTNWEYHEWTSDYNEL